MRIEIELSDTDPPTGRVRDERGHGEVFDGWLGLLRVLSELIGTAGEDH